MSNARPHLILTQDADGARSWQEQLARADIDTSVWPAFEVHALSDQAILDRFPSMGDGLRQIVVLPSPAAVRVLAAAMARRELGWPATCWAGVPGAGTAQVFRQCFGQDPCLIHPPSSAKADAEHLALALIDATQGTPAHRVHITLLNRPDGRTAWLEALAARGMQTRCHPIYQVRALRGLPPGLCEYLGRFRRNDLALHWLIGASEPLRTVAGWLDALPVDLAAWALARPLWLPHPRLRDSARRLGFARPQIYHDRQQLSERIQSGEV